MMDPLLSSSQFMGFLLISILLWPWLLLGCRKTGWRKVIGYCALNGSICCALFLGITDGMLAAVFGALLVPFVFGTIVSTLFSFASFLTPFIWWALAFGSLMIAIIWTVNVFKKLRLWSGIIGFISFLITAIILGDNYGKTVMCTEALKVGVNEVARNSFLWSVRNAPSEFQFGLHGRIVLNGIDYGWSYKELSFYEIPQNVTADAGTDILKCRT